MAAVTLRPNGDVSEVGDISINGGAGSNNAALADDSDSTYLFGGGPAGQIVVDLTTFTLGSGRVVDLYSVLRARRAGSVTVAVNCSIRAPGGENYAAAAAFVNSTSIADYTTARRGPGTLQTQAKIDAMRAVLDYTDDDVNLYELDVVVTYVPPPSTVLTAAGGVTPYTDATIVPLSWVNTLDADGGGQARYQIRTFDQTTYPTLGSVDPDTDTPHSDTGEVISSATSVNTPSLEDGETYRIALRVAQDIDGFLLWSDWSVDDVEIDVTTADITSVTATADDATGSIAVAVVHDSGSELWELVEVERTQDAGATWLPVRGATLVAPDVGSGGTFNVTDYTALRDTDAVYRARATRYGAGLPIVGPWTQATAVQWTGKTEFLKVPSDPTLNVAVERFTAGPSPVRQQRMRISDVVGRPDPIVAVGVRKTGRGTVALIVPDQATTDSVRAALEASSVMFDVPADLAFDDIRHAVVPAYTVETLTRPGASQYRRFTLDYQAVGEPADPDAGTL